MTAECPQCFRALNRTMVELDFYRGVYVPGGFWGIVYWCHACEIEPFAAYNPSLHSLEAE